MKRCCVDESIGNGSTIPALGTSTTRRSMSTTISVVGSASMRSHSVVTTASGLQYKVLKEGTGAIPTADDQVSVHYRGTLLDGTEFDSSYKRGQPAKFGVTGVIAGWTEALQLMKVGSKWQLWIPSQLAYAERGARWHRDRVESAAGAADATGVERIDGWYRSSC